MTDPKIAEIIGSVRAACFKVGKKLTDDKRVSFAVIIEGVGTFEFELTPDDAMDVSMCLAIPVAEALARGELP